MFFFTVLFSYFWSVVLALYLNLGKFMKNGALSQISCNNQTLPHSTPELEKFWFVVNHSFYWSMSKLKNINSIQFNSIIYYFKVNTYNREIRMMNSQPAFLCLANNTLVIGHTLLYILVIFCMIVVTRWSYKSLVAIVTFLQTLRHFV